MQFPCTSSGLSGKLNVHWWLAYCSILPKSNYAWMAQGPTHLPMSRHISGQAFNATPRVLRRCAQLLRGPMMLHWGQQSKKTIWSGFAVPVCGSFHRRGCFLRAGGRHQGVNESPRIPIPSRPCAIGGRFGLWLCIFVKWLFPRIQDKL